MNQIKLSSSEVSLLITNIAIPLFGTIFLAWSLSSIMFFYWLENIVVGLFNVARMSRAEGTKSTSNAKLNGKPYTIALRGQTIFFFIIHYGLFTFIHGIFVFSIFGVEGITTSTFLLGFLSLIFSHGTPYIKNFIRQNEYQHVSAADLFIRPYPRILVLHLVIILGAIPVLLLGSPFVALLILIIIKTLVDLKLQRWEQRKFATPDGQEAEIARPFVNPV